MRVYVVHLPSGGGLECAQACCRPELTGHGVVYFAEAMLHLVGQSLAGLRLAISASGMVALYAVQKCLQLGSRLLFPQRLLSS